MKPFVTAMVTAMKNDSTLAALTATYGAAEAIFRGRLVPDDVTKPYCVVLGPTANQPWDSKGSFNGHDITYNIACIAETEAMTDDMALAVFNLFHRQSLTVTGYNVADVRCGGPLQGPSDEEYVSKVVGINIKATATS